MSKHTKASVSSPEVLSARDALREITVSLDWLSESLLPGTRKPYRAPVMSAEKRLKRDLEDRAYREAALASGQVPLGESPAPMDLDVLDLVSEIVAAVDEITEQVSVRVHRPLLAPATSAFADPSPSLQIAIDNLELACTVDETLARWVEARCDDLTFRAHNQLGLLGDGQVLHVVCPWCDGRQGGRSGQETMRVRALLPPGKRSVVGVRPDDVRWVVICDGLNCTPDADEVGEWFRGRPAWPLATWSTWLADRLETARAC